MLALGRKTRYNRTHFSLSTEVRGDGEGAVFPQREGKAIIRSHKKVTVSENSLFYLVATLSTLIGFF